MTSSTPTGRFEDEHDEGSLHDFFDNASVGLHWVGSDGIILRANQKELDLLGYLREEYVGRHIGEFHTDPTVVSDMLARLTRGDTLQDYPARLRCKDGATRDVLVNSNALFKDGRFVHTRCFTVDVTERARAEERLQASEERLRLALSVARMVAGELDSATGKVIFSHNASDVFGLLPTHGLDYVADGLALLHPDDVERHRNTMNMAIAELGDYRSEIRVIRPTDGATVWLEEWAHAVRKPDGTVRLVGVDIDITARKEKEVERETLFTSERGARAEAERASRLKDDFLAVLSHEIRTPLAAILGWAQVLMKRPSVDELTTQGLSVIERNARVQHQLIADLLDMSRIISGKMRLEVQRVEIPVVIAAVLDSIRPAAEAKGIRIQQVLEPIPDAMHGDPARLQQVIWNLLSNAVKFTPKGGRVQVVLARVNSHIELVVSDTGKGISASFLPHAFERFRQADSSLTREQGGLGLGLAIVKQLVELHGGTVHVASDGEGKGSTFTVRLPLAVVHSAPESGARTHPKAISLVAPHCESPDLAGVRVLVVDDESDALDLLKRVLEECQAIVDLARSADEALALIDKVRPDVIVSDIGMPGGDGYALMKAIREKGIRAPAAALTAFARSEDRTRALQAGYQTHIAKPVEIAEFLATVASLAQINKSTRPR